MPNDDECTVGQRFKKIRQSLELSRRELGIKLGVSESTIVNIEFDRLKNPKQKEPLFKLFCKECNVNYLYLIEGIGEPFSKFPTIILDDLATTYGLNEAEKDMMKNFIEMPSEERKIVIKFLSSIKKDEQ